MAARFILSFDCEGKWGVADVLSRREHKQLTDLRLRQAYDEIAALLDEYDVPATFAFVGAFSQSARDFDGIRPLLEELRQRAPSYLTPALDDIAHGSAQGWHGDWAVDAVGVARTRHEIALHGVSHVPWNSVDAAFARRELEIVPQLKGPVRDSRTFVYPRNAVAHEQLLSDAGFEGYRTGRPMSRARSFLSEFDLFTRPEPVVARTNGAQPIPAGYFVNWKNGLRRLVPSWLSVLRAQRMLETARQNEAVVHYWLHPENVASAPETLALLRSLVRTAADARERGHCTILTQLDYCRLVSRSPAPGVDLPNTDGIRQTAVAAQQG